MISSICLIALAIQSPTTNWAKFNVAWRPESDAPFVKIRKEVEPYALNKTTTYAWAKGKAVTAFADWKKAPSSGERIYRAALWEKVLLTSHYNSITREDELRRGELQMALQRWLRVPTSFEFSRLVLSTISDPSLAPLARKVLIREPNDFLFVYWASRNMFHHLRDEQDISAIRKRANAFYAKHPNLWGARARVGHHAVASDRRDNAC